jgi:hypothetical protein
MGTEERDRFKRDDQPDVEAHSKGIKRANEEPKTEAEDRAQDDGPDVEAHMKGVKR